MAEINVEELTTKFVGKTLIWAENPGAEGENTVNESELPSPHRVLPEGSMATMDFVENRVNVNLDKNHVVVSITLG
jgi:hypothetical protein